STEPEDMNNNENEEMKQENNITMNEEEEVEANENNEENAMEETSATTEISSTRQCEKQDYSEVTDEVDTEIFIPECSIMVDVKKGEESVTANYKIEDESWKVILDEFRETYGDDLYDENIKFEAERGTAKMELDNGYLGSF